MVQKTDRNLNLGYYCVTCGQYVVDTVYTLVELRDAAKYHARINVVTKVQEIVHAYCDFPSSNNVIYVDARKLISRDHLKDERVYWVYRNVIPLLE